MEIGRYSYSIEKVKSSNEKDYLLNKLGIAEQLLTTGINTSYVRNKLLTDEVKKSTKKSNVINGTGGITIIASKPDNYNNDINVYYQMKVSIMGNINYKFRLSNRCYFRNWVGKSICEKSDEYCENDENVYITTNGKVYHLFKNCTYINIVVTEVEKDKISLYRNSNGYKYYECEFCFKNNKDNYSKVFITSDGKRFHSDKNCVKIDREVLEVKKSEIGNRRLCTKCKINLKT